MKTAPLTLPEIGAIGITRIALGVGLGLLGAKFVDDDMRDTIGWTLVGLGAAATIPLAADVFMKLEAPRRVARAETNSGGSQRRSQGRRPRVAQA